MTNKNNVLFGFTINLKGEITLLCPNFSTKKKTLLCPKMYDFKESLKGKKVTLKK